MNEMIFGCLNLFHTTTSLKNNYSAHRCSLVGMRERRHPLFFLYHHLVGFFPRCLPPEWDTVRDPQAILAHQTPSVSWAGFWAMPRGWACLGNGEGVASALLRGCDVPDL